MSADFFFDAVFLDDCGWVGASVSEAFIAATEQAGFTLRREPELDEDWTSLRLRGNTGLHLVVSVGMYDPGWVVIVADAQLRWGDGTPDEEAQATLLDLLRALIATAPPYFGSVYWPFGASAPEVYDTSTPFALRQVGSMLFLGQRYLETQLAGTNLAEVPVWRREELVSGVLLIADRDLLRSAEDGDLDELRCFFGLPSLRS